MTKNNSIQDSFSIVITAKSDNWASPVFDRVIGGNELKETIESALKDIDAQYPLTYADEITALIDYQDNVAIGYRVDTFIAKSNVIAIDSHYIYVQLLSDYNE